MKNFDKDTGPAPEEGQGRSFGRILAAVALLALGLLFLVPSGLCTGMFGYQAILQMNYASDNGFSTLVMALLFGGPFIVAGIAILWFAYRVFRKK